MPQFLAWLVAAQQEAGHQVHVVAAGHGGSEPTPYPVSVPQTWTPEGVGAALPTDTDVLHIQGEDQGVYTAQSPPPVPCLTTVHGNLDPETAADLPNPVFVSRNHAARHGASTFVHNGLPLAAFPLGTAPRSGLLFLGKLRRSKKGGKAAVRIARRAREPLVLAGPPTWKIPASRLPWWPGIRSAGAVHGETKAQLLRSARALLFPAQWDEPFGLVLLEAMASGTPVIGSDRGALPEVIDHGRTGFVCRSESEMVKAVGRLETLEAAACREHVARHFNIERVRTDYDALYRRAMAGERW